MTKRGLFIRKELEVARSQEEAGEGGQPLKRHLGSLNLTAIGIGAIIGAGIFIITGQAAALYAGPAIVLSFLIAFLICAFTGLCYAELAALIPSSGASYTYAYVALGEFPAWIVGWMVAVQYLVVASSVCVGWSGYFSSFLEGIGIHWNAVWMESPFNYAPGHGFEWTGAYLNVPAVLLVLCIGAFISVGIKAASRLNNVMVVIKLATILLFLVLGVQFIMASNLTPFIPENTGKFGEYGWSGILRGAGVVFFAFLGFDAVATLAQETKEPQRSMPKGILFSLAICTLAYVCTSLVLTGIVAYPLLNVPDPMAIAMRAMGPGYFWLRMVVEIAILAGLASVVLVILMAITRILYTMSRDGLFFRRFGQVHKRFQTPVFSTAVMACITAVLAGVFPLSILGEIVSMSALFIFGFVCLSVLVLRKTHPGYKRSFKVPFVPYIPIAGFIGCVGQMCFLPLTAWLQLTIWLGLGALIYYFYGRKYSKLKA